MQSSSSDNPSLVSSGKVIAALAALLGCVGVGMLVGGELGDFMTASMQVLPFVVLAILAYLAIEQFWAKVVSVLWLGMLLFGFAVFCLMWSMLALTDPSTVQSFASPSGTSLSPQLQAGGLRQLGVVFLVLGGASLLGIPGFLPAVRRVLSRVVPLEPDSFVHTIALVTVVSVSLMACVPLLVLNEPPILAASSIAFLEESMTSESAAMSRFEIYAMLWTIVGAFFIVGLGVRRTMHDVLKRLGFVRPTAKQLLAGIILSPLLVAAVLVMGMGIDWLWNFMGWPITNERALEVVFSSSLNPLGALISSVAAGVGEELAVRGVLQPRMGIFLSNFFFASMHALQYHWDGFFSVFLIGLVFAVIRQRTNTTTSAILHTGYDLVLFNLIMTEMV